MDRREQITNEVWSAITHGIGVGLSIWLLVLLILKGIATQKYCQFYSISSLWLVLIESILSFDFISLFIFHQSPSVIPSI